MNNLPVWAPFPRNLGIYDLCFTVRGIIYALTFIINTTFAHKGKIQTLKEISKIEKLEIDLENEQNAWL